MTCGVFNLTMCRLVVVVCCFALVNCFDTSLDGHWEMFKASYVKSYQTSQVETMRRRIWEYNMNYVDRHNIEASQGLHSYTLAMNKYGDLTNEEFVSVMNGAKTDPDAHYCPLFKPPNNTANLPDSLDLREEGFVTSVKSQEVCGSCWAFAAIGCLEGQHFKKTGELVELSPSNLIDCSKTNEGCTGGIIQNAFDYVIQNGGIDTEEAYPYVPKDGECKFKPDGVGATAVGCMNIRPGSEEDLKAAVATIGPISVNIDSNHRSFQLYKSGMYDEPDCKSDDENLHHAVLVVGYGTEDSKDYWLIKNSWGDFWGDNGYIKMSRNKNNQCGIATDGCFPVM